MIAMLRQELEPKGRYLVENDAVPKYYFRTETTPEQWTSTYFIDYTDRSGERLYGERGYRAALSDGYFDVIVLNWTVTKELDNALVRQLRTNDKYRMLGKLPYQTTLRQRAITRYGSRLRRYSPLPLFRSTDHAADRRQ